MCGVCCEIYFPTLDFDSCAMNAVPPISSAGSPSSFRVSISLWDCGPAECGCSGGCVSCVLEHLPCSGPAHPKGCQDVHATEGGLLYACGCVCACVHVCMCACVHVCVHACCGLYVNVCIHFFAVVCSLCLCRRRRRIFSLLLQTCGR